MRKVKIIGLTCLLFYQTFAQEKIETDRPDQTETPVLTPKNYFQGEIGFNREKYTDRSINYIHPVALLKYGLSKRIEFRFEGILETIKNDSIKTSISGLYPIKIGTKLFIAEEKGIRPLTSLIIHMGLPFLSSTPFKTTHAIPSFRFTFQNTFSDVVAIGYNAGAEWDGESSTPTWIYTFAPGFNLSDKWYSYIELFGDIKQGNKPDHKFDAGLAYFVNKDLKLDISGGIGISSYSVLDHYFSLGFSFRTPLKNSKKL